MPKNAVSSWECTEEKGDMIRKYDLPAKEISKKSEKCPLKIGRDRSLDG